MFQFLKKNNMETFRHIAFHPSASSAPASASASASASTSASALASGANRKRVYTSRKTSRASVLTADERAAKRKAMEIVSARRVRSNVLDMTLPEVQELSDTQKEVLLAVNRRMNVFVSGRAGSGKSRAINVLEAACQAAGSNVAVTAASGIAACQINGTTLHTLCCMGIDETARIEPCVAAARRKHGEVLNGLDVLIIDEISMLSANTLENALRIINAVRNSAPPIVVLVGDFCQLPPSGRGVTSVLESDVWKALNLQVVVLESTFRQTDAAFVKLLDEVRVGSVSDASLIALQSRVGVTFPGDVRPTTLTPLRSVADVINAKELATLKTEHITFTGKVMAAVFDAATSIWMPVPGVNTPPKLKTESTFRPYAALDGLTVSLPDKMHVAWDEASTLVKNARQPSVLVLAVGAQVLFTANLSPPRIANGTRGVVTAFRDSNPVVQLVTGEEVVVTPFAATKRANFKHLSSPVSYVYQQYPLQHGWAMTIHKSQGMSIDRAEIDLGNDVFSKGQAYVALSRLRSFNGLALIAFSKSSIKTDEAVVRWYRHEEDRRRSQKEAETDADADAEAEDHTAIETET